MEERPEKSGHHRAPLTRLLLCVTVIVWGSTFVATKICLDYLTPSEVLGLRLLLALPVLALLVFFRKVRLDFNSTEKKRLLCGSAVFTAHFLIQITGMQFTSATNTGWIISVSPLAIACLSFVFLKEKIHKNVIMGIVVATTGILFLISKGDLSTLDWLKSPGDWLVLVSAITWALYTVMTRDLSRSGDPLAVTFALLLPATALMTVYMAFTSEWGKVLHLPAAPLIAILFLGVVAMGFANWWWQSGVAKIGASKAGIFLYLEPVATTCLAVPLLHESFGYSTAFGGLLVLGGVFWAEKRK